MITAVIGNLCRFRGCPPLLPHLRDERRVLIGQPQPIRIPEWLWRFLLDDPAVVAGFEAKQCCLIRSEVDRFRTFPGCPGVVTNVKLSRAARHQARLRGHLPLSSSCGNSTRT